MVPTARETRQPGVCTHGRRGKDALGVCIPCRDEQVFCRDCGQEIAVAQWIRFGRRCEPCDVIYEEQLDLAIEAAEGARA